MPNPTQRFSRTPEGYVTPAEFARKKNVSRDAVYYQMYNTARITYVPHGKRLIINWKENKHVDFPFAKKCRRVMNPDKPQPKFNETVREN
jgi:hypothetical protein